MTGEFDDIYYQGFEQLTFCSNEKEIYREKFSEYISWHNVSSVLDIGAGDGDVAIPLSSQVDHYVAVEHNPDYARILDDAGLTVIPRKFPSNITGRFDLVIMSHIMSHTSGNYRELLPHAWKLVKPNGHLLVVTHRTEDDNDDWSRLLDSAGLGYSEGFQANVHSSIEAVRALGETESETVESTLRSPDISAILGAMAFRASNGEQTRHEIFMNRADKIRQLLDEQYRSEYGYTFPFLQLFMSVYKPVA